MRVFSWCEFWNLGHHWHLVCMSQPLFQRVFRRRVHEKHFLSQSDKAFNYPEVDQHGKQFFWRCSMYFKIENADFTCHVSSPEDNLWKLCLHDFSGLSVCVCVRSFPSPCFRVSCTLTPCAFINTRRILPIQSSLTSLKTVFWLLDIFLTYGYICRIWQSPPRLYLPDPVFKTKSIWSSLERVNSSLWNIAPTGDDNS